MLTTISIIKRVTKVEKYQKALCCYIIECSDCLFVVYILGIWFTWIVLLDRPDNMDNSNYPTPIQQFPSFCKALGITKSDIDAAVLGEYQSSRKIKFNHGAVLEIYRYVLKQVNPLYSAMCAFSEDCKQVTDTSLCTKAKAIHDKVAKDRKKNKPQELLTYLSSDFVINPQSAAHKVRKENEGLKRSLDEQRETNVNLNASMEEQVQEQVQKKVKIATEEITKQYEVQMQNMKEELDAVRKAKESNTRNLNKKVDRRDIKLQELKEKFQVISMQAKKNAEAVKTAQAEVDGYTAEMETLREQMENLRRVKKLAQNKVSYYRNIA